jgi:hypothetical protein
MSLKTVTLDVAAYWFRDARAYEWDGLDSAVAALTSVERLKIMYLSREVTTSFSADLDNVVRRLPSQFPLCVARGIVTEDVILDQLPGSW